MFYFVFFFFLATTTVTAHDECRDFVGYPEPISQIEERMFEMMVQKAVNNAQTLKARAIIRAIAESPQCENFPRSLKFGSNLKEILEGATLYNYDEQQPFNIDVKNAYDRYVRHVRLLRAQRLFWHKSQACQTVMEAAIYFAKKEAWSLSDLFKEYINEFNCHYSYLVKIPTQQ